MAFSSWIECPDEWGLHLGDYRMQYRIEIKHCPFVVCGSYDIAYNPDYEAVECNHCGALGPSLPVEEDAIAAWNDVRRLADDDN